MSVADATSQAGTLDVEMLAHASTLTRGSYTLQLTITNKADGTGVDDLALDIVPWMPAMGHGTPIKPTIVPLGAGGYEIDDVNLFMAGMWELRTTITTPADYVAPSVQVH